MSLTKLPGMIDVHTHLRDPGATQKEDFYSGTSAALAGGVTLLLDMPNNPLPTISYKALKDKEKIAQQKAVCDFGLIFGASQTDNTGEFRKIISRVCALKLYLDQTTGTLLVEKLALLEKIFQKWESQKPIMIHAEDATLLKALTLTSFYKKRVHFCHVSLKEEVELIKKAKEKGMTVTCEVTPHHLFLTEKDTKKLGPYGIMKPPLRSQKDIDVLWQGINTGVIDIVATDHAPHTKEEKENPPAGGPPFGVPGLETALPLLLTAYKEKRLTLSKVIELYHENPRKIFKLPIQKNTYIEVDLKSKWEIKNDPFDKTQGHPERSRTDENLLTKCGWTPFQGFKVYGKVHKVIIRKKLVYKDRKIFAQRGFGRNVLS